ncbi:MAG: sulfatase-like hydrolase/transferase [Opitutales bacterium]|jgi:arylsulfatase A|nr:sulfatase-like hydrolase/transferase [Akkermansiaceae bacterium]MDP4644582.1 sulfatase-like hydrolase/transferase [Opitutales bacterium]MDP4721593.1 sulfatase-like hydrolase/transferase [Akkermansiaceae bacterium]MDP4779465.1 sulfatase-like hydrolase/transferase [Akkermansiaceae bacterium]MDP4846805.1 sulfatase-like hydrolase/transferase [Akkermansiaceae bacterium]
MKTLLFSLLLALFAQASPAKQPNVVFILIDDLSHYGISAYGSEKMAFKGNFPEPVALQTPRIDALAEEGMLCERAFAYPLCEPTRIALMTGKLNHRNLLQKKSQHASDITFSDSFKKAGYKTGVFGKWKQSRGTKEIHAKKYLHEFGYDKFCCFDLVKQGNRFFNPDLVIDGEIKRFDDSIDPETGRRWFGPDICNRHALNFIEENKDQPFFLYYSFALVHKEDEGNYHVPTPDSTPHDEFDKFDDDFQSPEGNDRSTRKHFPDMIRYTDTLVGQVVDKLDELKLRENTLIVLMGDNGTQIPFIHVLKDGTEYPGKKGTTTDHGTHVPLIFSQPGRISKGTYPGLVDLIDIYPTLCASADVPYQTDIDGLNFWPQILNQGSSHRDHIYVYYEEPYFPEAQNKGEDPVTLRYAFDKKYKRYAPHKGFPRGRFFDIETDSQELAGDKKVKAPNFGIIYKSGLDLDKLTPEQSAAFDRLGAVINSHKTIPLKSLKITPTEATLSKSKSVSLKATLTPANATRNNVIWESSDPSIASIDKFGTLTAHQSGTVKINLYSWQDAHPTANNEPVTYFRNGITDSISLTIK